MTIKNVTRVVYGLLGILYVLIGAGSMLLPTGWLPHGTDGLIGSWRRGITNSIPLAVMLLLGLLQLRASRFRWR